MRLAHFLFPGFAILLGSSAVTAQSLTSPLTLQQALEVAREHPSIAVANSQLDLSRAKADLVKSESGLTVTATGYLAAVEPSDLSVNRSNNDSRAILSARKRLYDFGYSQSRESAAEEAVASSEWLTMDKQQQHLLKVMNAFYSVLIADKKYVLKNEEMTMAYLRYDKARDRHELGTVSDVDLLELENGYRLKLQERKQAEQEQRFTRIMLANYMNRPDEVPAELVAPEVNWQKDLPDINTVVNKALEKNVALKAARASLNAAQHQLKASQSSGKPVISGEMSVADYNRETGSTHKAMAGLVLEVPLYTGGRVGAEKAQALAQLKEKQSRLDEMELIVRQQAIEQLLALETLKADLQAQEVSEAYGELYLDKNRALYELEVASDFGDAVVRVSDVILKKIQSELNYALAEARLSALMGDDFLNSPVEQ